MNLLRSKQLHGFQCSFHTTGQDIVWTKLGMKTCPLPRLFPVFFPSSIWSLIPICLIQWKLDLGHYFKCTFQWSLKWQKQHEAFLNKTQIFCSHLPFCYVFQHNSRSAETIAFLLQVMEVILRNTLKAQYKLV